MARVGGLTVGAVVADDRGDQHEDLRLRLAPIDPGERAVLVDLVHHHPAEPEHGGAGAHQAQIVHRITSYNVCYTKLLREAG